MKHPTLVSHTRALLSLAGIALTALAAPVDAQVCGPNQSLGSFGVETGQGCWLYLDQAPSIAGQNVSGGEALRFDGVGTGILCSPCDLGCGASIDLTMNFGSFYQGGAGGLVLGYCPGDATAPSPDYLVALWGEATGSPLQLLRVTQPLDAAGGFQSPQQIATSALGHDGLLNLSITIAPDRLTILDDGATLIDETGDFSAYLGACSRLCLVGQQQDLDWFNLTITPAAGPAASWENYGVGTPGCFGVPTLGLADLPRIGTAVDILIGNRAFEPRWGLMLWGIGPAQTFVPLLGGDLLVAAPFLAAVGVDVPFGGLPFQCSIPDDCASLGDTFYLQVITIDPCGPAGVAMTRGLRIQIGL